MLAEEKDLTAETVLEPTLNEAWVGLGIAYSPYRDGQSPDNKQLPSKKQILEDLTLLTSNEQLSWHLIRLYAADLSSERVLEVIKENKLPIKVMQGAWLSGNQTLEENEEQLAQVVSFANRFPNIIIAVNLGNEIFVEWSYHKFEKDEIPQYLKWVKSVQKRVAVPVTLADDYNFWNKPWSKSVADQVDFIVLHAYAMWNSKLLKNSVAWTEKIFRGIQSQYPEKQIVLGESGWATSSLSSNGDERLIIAEASEKAQAKFFKGYRQWLTNNRIVSFYFQAFDENWKGGMEKPKSIAEKNWGIYRADRTPKLVVKEYLTIDAL
ncbi:MAG: glycosyl hydrolase family 17 [Gammaproteobacteria bacterium]|nr:glycosyl hydrolase family 17 [Gammaproteobacteria bacterium]